MFIMQVMLALINGVRQKASSKSNFFAIFWRRVNPRIFELQNNVIIIGSRRGPVSGSATALDPSLFCAFRLFSVILTKLYKTLVYTLVNGNI